MDQGRYLHEILADGTIVDNRHYRYHDGLLALPHNSLTINGGRGWTRVDRVFDFLRATAKLAAGADAAPTNVVIVGPDGYEHNTEDPFLALSGFGADDFTLQTGNLVGSISLRDKPDYALNISSRFGDAFLKFIVADADGFAELPDLGAHADGGLHWLLPYLWAVKMRKAWRLGLPKLYATRAESTPHVRGRIDPLSHITGESLARYHCSYREHSYDNPATRLIARVLQLNGTPAFLPDAQQMQRTFQAATHGARHHLPELLATAPVRNPYYSDYNPLIELSKLILRGHSRDIGAGARANALLFDVSVLFEYFIRKLLKRRGLSLQGKSSVALAIPAGLPDGRLRRLIPDLIFDAGGRQHVFDVKYKSFDFVYGAAREDLFQLHTYVSQVSARGPVGSCGFIYPVSERQWDKQGLQRYGGVISQPFRHGAQQMHFHVVFLKVPDQDGLAREEHHAGFAQRFAASCEDFVRGLRQAIDPSPGNLNRTEPHASLRHGFFCRVEVA